MHKFFQHPCFRTKLHKKISAEVTRKIIMDALDGSSLMRQEGARCSLIEVVTAQLCDLIT